MENKKRKWEVLSSGKNKDIFEVLLENRGITTKKDKEEFLNPIPPEELTIHNLGINEEELTKSIARVKKAIKDEEEIIIYGDYDADGICSTAIIWEILYKYTKKVTPYIPDRFSEGYGINPDSILKIKSQNSNLKLIITVDNGIVAFGAIDKARELGIDVIITDHHQKDSKLPEAYSIVHTDKIAGSGVAWVFAREILSKLQTKNYKSQVTNSLELAAIGTIADQLPLTGPNRSIAKSGLISLTNTKRPGLIELFRESAILASDGKPQVMNTYEVNYLIAPRLNATGRLEHAIDSLRLLCTTDKKRAYELANHIGNINRKRQKIVDEVLQKARIEAEKDSAKSAIVVSGDYHEGVIGLAAGKLVEDFSRPAIVFSESKDKSKASARSIPGFNIIEQIKKLDNLLIACGGHPMAAGLSIETKNINKFKNIFQKNSLKLLTDELLVKALKIDTHLEFNQINYDLIQKLDNFKPFGIGNPSPSFITEKVKVTGIKAVGAGQKHLKLRLQKDGINFDAIAFNFGDMTQKLSNSPLIDIVYSIEENIWNGNRSLQLKIKDLKLA